MKREIMAIGLMAVIICASGCQKENPAETKNIIPVVKSISTTTKASLSDDAEQLLFSAPVKSDAGEEYTLEAWISDTACEMPETKGTPVTSSNIQTAYGSFKTTAYCDGQIHDGINGATVNSQGNGKWEFADTHHWPKDKSKSLTFCSVAPSGTWTSNVSGLDWHGGEYATFTYTLPAPSGTGDAVSQQDLLLAIDAGQTQGTNGEAEINFHHALTSVKFTRGDIKDCTISSISLENIYDTGNATYNGGWTWTIPSGTAKKTYKQSFGTDVDDVSQATDANQSGGSLDPDTGESHTFMVIPQNLSGNSAKINITLDSGDTMTYDLSGSDNDAIKDWSTYAGKTVTFKVNKKDPMFDVVIVMDMSSSLATQTENYYINGKKGSSQNIATIEKYCVSSLLDSLKKKGVSVSLIYFSGGSYSEKLNSSPTSVYDTRIINHFSDLMGNGVVENLKSTVNSSSFKYNTSYNNSYPNVALQEASYEFSEKGRTGSDRVVVVFSDFLYCSGLKGDGIDTGTYTFTTSGASDAVVKSKSLKDNGVRVFSIFCPCGEWVNTSTSNNAYKNMRSYARSISSDYPNATKYNDGANGPITNNSYTYTLYLQDLDVLMGTIASEILK